MDDESEAGSCRERCYAGFGWTGAFAVVSLLSAAILQVDDIIRLFWLGTLANVVLSVTKLGLAQVTLHQKALVADAVHGLGDTAAEVVTALAYAEAAKPPDKEHPWGHGKIESVGAVVVTCILLYISFSMGYDSITSLAPLLKDAWRRGTLRQEASASTGEPSRHKETRLERRVRQQAIAVGVASVLLKEALYRATLTAGEQVQSNLAVATAWHHRSDSLAAAVALASQLGTALTNCPGLDSLGGGVVAAMLGYSAVDSLHDSLNDLLDYNRAAEDDGEGEGRMSCCSGAALARTITQVQGVRNHTLRTRRMGPFCLVDVTIIVDARISASAASMIAENVHDHVIYEFRPAVTDVLVHVDPDGSPQSHRLATHSEASTVAEHFETVEMLNPEELEAQIRAALLEEAGADLPKIAEVTELHTYYYMEEPAPENQWKLSSYVDIKVDIRLYAVDTTIRQATAAGRAARLRVRRALPIVRDVDVNLQLDLGAEKEAPAPEAMVPKVQPATCAPDALRRHGSWGAEPCLAEGSPAEDGASELQDRRLRQVKLIWERGPEARKARVPYVSMAGQGFGEKITWKQMPRWHPLLVHWARQHQRDQDRQLTPLAEVNANESS